MDDRAHAEGSNECGGVGHGGSERWSEGDRMGQGETVANVVKPSGEMGTGGGTGKQGQETGTK